jgi:hypothetical protein
VSDFLNFGKRKTPSPAKAAASSSAAAGKPAGTTQSAQPFTINVTDGTLIPAGEKSILSAWNIAFFGAIAFLVVLPVISPKP